MNATLLSLQVGMPQPLPYAGKTVRSGFVKHAVQAPIWLNRDGLAGDEQADLKNHGGPNKAVCVYPREHYHYWAERLARELPVATFGENFTTQGFVELNVHIGDIFKVGGAVVQVSQPRQPCFKLTARHNLPKLALWLQETGLTGFYFRCLEVGWVSPGEAITLVERNTRSVPVAEANRVMHHDKSDTEGIERLLAIPELSDNWRETFEKRLTGQYKNDKARLEGTTSGVR